MSTTPCSRAPAAAWLKSAKRTAGSVKLWPGWPRFRKRKPSPRPSRHSPAGTPRPALKQREQSGRKALLRLSPAEISFRPCRNDFPPDWGLFCEQRTQDFLGLCSDMMNRYVQSGRRSGAEVCNISCNQSTVWEVGTNFSNFTKNTC